MDKFENKTTNYKGGIKCFNLINKKKSVQNDTSIE